MGREERSTETEERIFEAALKVFGQKGKEGARMQEIADEAGINKAMLHYYFRSKDRLYEEVFGFVMRRFLGSFAQALRHADTFEEMLRAFIDTYIDFVAENLSVVRLMVNENLSGGPVMVKHIRAFVETSEYAPPRFFAVRVQEAVRRGEIRPVDPLQLLLTVVAGCAFPFLITPILNLLNPEAAQNRPAFLAARKAHLFDVIYHGLRPAPPA